MDYNVTWEIGVEADSPEAAAQLAKEWLRDETALVQVYKVWDDEGEDTTIDLNDFC